MLGNNKTDYIAGDISIEIPESYFTKCFFQHDIKIGHNWISDFIKMSGQKDLRSMKKIRPTLCSSISGTKSDRETESPYHAQVWEYPPRELKYDIYDSFRLHIHVSPLNFKLSYSHISAKPLHRHDIVSVHFNNLLCMEICNTGGTYIC